MIGSGVGVGFTNTQELHVIKCKEAMATSKQKEWKQAVEEELDRFIENDVFEVVKLKDLPKGVKMLIST